MLKATRGYGWLCTKENTDLHITCAYVCVHMYILYIYMYTHICLANNELCSLEKAAKVFWLISVLTSNRRYRLLSLRGSGFTFDFMNWDEILNGYPARPFSQYPFVAKCPCIKHSSDCRDVILRHRLGFILTSRPCVARTPRAFLRSRRKVSQLLQNRAWRDSVNH